MNSSNRGRLLALGLLAALLTPASVSAQDASPSAAEERLARTLREQGVEAARAGDWERARDQFQRSYDLDPRVLTLYNLAAAQMNSGALVAADEGFRQFLRATEAGSHEQFRAEAERSRQALASQISYVTLNVTGIADADSVTIDGAPLARAALGVPLALDPGAHEILVLRGGEQVGRSALTLEEGSRESIEIVVADALAPVTVEPDPDTPEDDPRVSVAPVASERAGSDDTPWIVLGVVLGAVVVAGLAIGGYFLFSDQGPQPYVGDFNIELP